MDACIMWVCVYMQVGYVCKHVCEHRPYLHMHRPADPNCIMRSRVCLRPILGYYCMYVA